MVKQLTAGSSKFTSFHARRQKYVVFLSMSPSAVNILSHIVGGTWTTVSVKCWWNDTDKGKFKFSDKNSSECYFVHNKSHMDWSETQAKSEKGKTDKERKANIKHDGNK